MIYSITLAEVEDAIELDSDRDCIAQLETGEAMKILDMVEQRGGTDLFGLVALGILYGYKVGWYKAKLYAEQK